MTGYKAKYNRGNRYVEMATDKDNLICMTNLPTGLLDPFNQLEPYRQEGRARQTAMRDRERSTAAVSRREHDCVGGAGGASHGQVGHRRLAFRTSIAQMVRSDWRCSISYSQE
ncbi:protein of unknown function (plasmid) [Caballeronia sp. S22]